jgi:hypothetical protein
MQDFSMVCYFASLIYHLECTLYDYNSVETATVDDRFVETTLLKCWTIRISRLSDDGLKEFCRIVRVYLTGPFQVC